MPFGNILVVEDDSKIRSLLKRIFVLEGYSLFESSDIQSANRVLKRENIDVIICDVMLPDGNGIDFTKTVKEKFHNLEVIILTAQANIADGVKAMRNGAFDYITKGDDNDKLIPLVSHAMEKAKLQSKVIELEKQIMRNYGFENIIGKSPPIQETIALAQKVAPLDTTVLLLGETGTGKELFARAIHSSGKRFLHPFVALNCSAISKSLLESEIFGHKAGAFTGAFRDKKGLVEEADGGTLFLDEIGEMNIELQAKLLRVLETNEFIKVGDTKSIKVDVRVIAATNRNLEEEVRHGRFRKDLFYRLNVFTIYIPSLRERKKDIPILAEYFLHLYARKAPHPVESMSKDFIKLLQNWEWKGNVRELKNVIERAVILSNGSQLTVDSLPPELRTTSNKPQALSSYNLTSIEKSHIQRVLKHTRGNKVEAAKLLNIGLTTLYRKIEEYDLNLNFFDVEYVSKK
ncbi:MAG TPA: sigma-54 dependent transcriptional regulator [Puia sp.]|nr:sigma-54 dependent transcriptional regulator [Puia sp.]